MRENHSYQDEGIYRHERNSYWTSRHKYKIKSRLTNTYQFLSQYWTGTNKKTVTEIVLDLPKAFDQVDYGIFLYKFDRMDFCGVALESY